MDIFSLFTLVGGLAFFLYGMTVMSGNLEKMAGGKLETILRSMTSSLWKSLLFGAGITIAIQSSSAMTVMLVGLVNSGIMTLEQSVGLIMGSNIGTTLTSWIFGLSALQSSGFLFQLIKPKNFAPLAAFIGILFIMISKKPKKKDLGGILVGFAILMFGMELMSGAVEPLRDMPEFTSILTFFTNPILGVLVGTIFTGAIQSSAASVGILQALASTGGITFRMAIPIIMGQNIGTCVTSLLSSIGVNKGAKRVSVVHVTFNIVGTIVGLVVFYGLDFILHYTFMDLPINAFYIAVCHSVFNVCTTLLFIPFTKQLVWIANTVIKDDEKEDVYSFIDERLLKSPSFAIQECSNMTKQMAHIAQQQLQKALHLITEYDESLIPEIDETEAKLDMYEDKLGTYLIQVSSQNLSKADSEQVFKLLHIIGDFERIGDHADNIKKIAITMHENGDTFSEKAKEEILILAEALTKVVDMTVESFDNSDINLAMEVEPLEEVIDKIILEMKGRHIVRLQKGECTLTLGYQLSDLLNNYERASDHCSNVAIAIIEISQNAFDTHEFIHNYRDKDNETFKTKYKAYRNQYRLPSAE